MKKSLAQTSTEQEEASSELARFAADRSNSPEMRCWALRSLGRVERPSEEAVRKVGALVASPGEHEVVRAWAAWALGEMRRKEAIPYMISVLGTDVDHVTGYYVLEGLTKVVQEVLADPEINRQVVEAMTVFSSRQAEFLPEMFDLLNEQVANLVVLAATLEQISGLANEGAMLDQPRDSDAVYAAVYRLLAHMQGAKEKYRAAFDRHQHSLKKAFDLAFESVDSTHRPSLLLLAWYAGVLGNNKELASLSAAAMIKWARESDPLLRFMAVWALLRMEVHNSSARQELVKQVLTFETNEGVLRLLAWSRRGGPDTLQRLLDVRAEEAR